MFRVDFGEYIEHVVSLVVIQLTSFLVHMGVEWNGSSFHIFSNQVVK